MSMKSLTPWFRKSPPLQRAQHDYPVYSLQREINSLINDFLQDLDVGPWQFNEEQLGDYVPCIDMHENEKDITVSVELPGMQESDVNVSISKDVLMISGEKKSEKIENAKGHYKMERSYGSFKRAVQLPVEVDRDRCEATFKNGVLTVVLPKTAESQKNVKGIPIKKG